MGERGYEEGWGRWRLCTYRYTVTTRMIRALKWAAMRAILMFHNCEGHSHKTVSTDPNFWRERTAEADSNRGPSAYRPNALPLGQTGSLFFFFFFFLSFFFWGGGEGAVCMVMYTAPSLTHLHMSSFSDYIFLVLYRLFSSAVTGFFPQ